MPKSPRGKELYFDGLDKGLALRVTVERYQKWYGLIVVEPLKPRMTQEVPFPEWIESSHLLPPAWVDHVPNPFAVLAWARANGFYVDLCALGAMQERWMEEVTNGP